MNILGYVAQYPDGSYAHPYKQRGSIKLYLKAGFVKAYHPQAKCIPVFVKGDARVCQQCGHAEDDHPYRHIFVPVLGSPPGGA